MEINYTVDHFIKKFEAIPEQDWCVDTFTNSEKYPIKTKKKFLGIIPYTETKYEYRNTSCAQGHCMNKQIIEHIKLKRDTIAISQIAKSYPEWNALINILGINKEGRLMVATINNGDHPDYQQPTAKQRILKALYDIKEKQSESITENVIKKLSNKKELILN